ncbi:hypothetical protein GCM10022224_038890 [Nonomuraea antimicrobica]|uniref:Secreted protein n=1 Tax=Nonomuraea antimicrobica TaxID=561173 RepID=A0ABP7BZL3_9ACTN
MARPAAYGRLAVALTVTMAPNTMAPAANADKDPGAREFRHFRGIHSDRGFHTGRTDDGDGRNCRPRTFFRIHELSPRNFYVPRTQFVDGPGGSITVSVTREHQVTAFVEAANEKEKQAETKFAPAGTNTGTNTGPTVTAETVVERLRRLGLPHLQQRNKVFTGHEYTRKISDGMYGHMWYRVLGYRAAWSAWSVLGTCERRKVAAGIANVPSRVEGWRYWESRHPTFKHRKLSER